MDSIEVLAALATILAAGFGALTLILRDPKCLSFAEQLALSWLGGTGIVSLSIWLFGFVLSGPALFSVVSSTCRLENKRSVSSSRIASTKSNRTCVGLHSLRRNPGSRLSGLRLHAWMGRTFKLGNQS